MNQYIDFIQKRRSIRKFKDEMISQEELNTIIETGLCAPSGKNLQDTIILVIKDQNVIQEMAKDNCKIGDMPEGTDPFFHAPVVLVVLGKKENPNTAYDGALVMENLMLAATALNIGSCWINRARQLFEMPKWQNFLKKKGLLASTLV